MSNLSYSHPEGPGLKILDRSTVWYGPGHCCGRKCISGFYLIPQAVRFWDPNHGWKVGVLCTFCGLEAARRGPKPDDYATTPRVWDPCDGSESMTLTERDCRDLIDLDAEVSAGDLDHRVEDWNETRHRALYCRRE